MKYYQNIGKPPVRVSHAELIRWSPDSVYKSKCPKCPDGILLVSREESEAFFGRLRAEDCCIVCGQLFVYTDIERLRKMEAKR
jgi:hypothetical protein